MRRKTQQIRDLLKQKKKAYSATFIFRVRQTDEEFEQLNNQIDDVAASNDGFLGREGWSNEKESKRVVVYYWSSLEALKKFSNHPTHQKAKQHYQKWYSGFEVIISEVVQFKSDENL